MRTLIVLGVAATLPACGDKAAKSTSQQVVATVNGNELTQSQWIDALRAAPEVDALRALDNLIDQELLMQQALTQKLDRDPAVLQMLESARRQTLARAYVQRQVMSRSVVASSELTQFYRENPALFAQRKIYRLHNFRIDAQRWSDAALRAQLEQATAEGELEKILAAQHVAFESEVAEQPAEKLPITLLPEFVRASIGDILVAPESDGKVVLMQIVAAQEQPLTLEQATPHIEGYLLATRGREALATKLSELRAGAHIEYTSSREALSQRVSAPAEAAATADANANPQAGVN